MNERMKNLAGISEAKLSLSESKTEKAALAVIANILRTDDSDDYKIIDILHQISQTSLIQMGRAERELRKIIERLLGEIER